VLVLRRNPLEAPPPPEYRLEWSGRYYEVWSKGEGARRVASRTSATFETAGQPLPSRWVRRDDDPSLVQTLGPGEVRGTMELKQGGRYTVWLRGSFGRAVEVWIDGRDAGSAADELAQPANWLQLGSAELSAGPHRVELRRAGGSLAPGNGDGPRTLGQLVLRRAGQGAAVSLRP
jgi:hypothetical protein